MFSCFCDKLHRSHYNGQRLLWYVRRHRTTSFPGSNRIFLKFDKHSKFLNHDTKARKRKEFCKWRPAHSDFEMRGKGMESVSVFDILWRQQASTWARKPKLTVNFLAFPSVKFHKICQTCNRYFNWVEVFFFREIYLTSFYAAVKDMTQRWKIWLFKNRKKCPYKRHFNRV